MKKNFLQILALCLVFMMIFSACERATIVEDTTTLADADVTTDSTTEEPTEEPTTEYPTTEAPTTESPTTEAPTTEKPTEAPTDEPPTDEPPTNESPTDEPPTDEPPTDEPPTDEPPTDEPPTDEPPTDEPPTDEPPTDEPPTDEPPTDEPPTDEPPTDEPPTDEPPTDEPPTDEPPTDEPPTDEPPTDEPPAECEHDWIDADCDTPKTCSKCHATDGSALGHAWSNADCTTPKTCSRCHATDGSALGHAWSNADCTTPKTCSRCHATDGSALGHAWSNADCTTPKTCSRCHATDGSALGHAWSNADCTTPKTCSRCHATDGSALGHSWNDADCTTPKTCSKCGATEGTATGHSYEGNTCTKCGHVNTIPPVETPADKPVSRVENSPYQYFNCCSNGYVAYNDGVNIAGSLCIDHITPYQVTGGTNFAASYKHGMTVSLPDLSTSERPHWGMYEIKGWVGINTTDYTLGQSFGMDDERTWNIPTNILITPQNASQNADYTAVLAAANAAGYKYAIRFVYQIPSYAVNSGEIIHLWAQDNSSSIKYCFGEFKLVKPGQETVFSNATSLDVIKPSGNYPSYSKTNTTITIPSTDLILGRDFALSGWIASNLTDKNDANIANKYNIIVRVNGQSYTVSFKNRTAELVNAGVLNGWTGYVAFEGTFKLNNVKNGDVLHLILVRKGTGNEGKDDEFVFASYTIKVTESTASYNLKTTVTTTSPNTEKVTAPNEDASLKLWFDHLTQKTSRYDTSNKNSTASSYTIQMARNEMEGCHFYLYSPTNKKVTIKVSDFMNEYGETLETELGVEFYLEDGYISHKGFTEGQTSAAGNVVAVYPDAVIPYESYIKDGFGGDEGGSYEYGTWVPIGPYSYKPWELNNYPYRDTVRGFTIQATTLRTSRPGQYSATVEIYDAETGECIKMANVYTYVYDVVLSEETALDTYIGVWNEYYIQTYQKAGGYSDVEVIKALANFMLDYRLTPIMGGWATESVLGVEWLYNPRVTTFRVGDKATYDKYKNDPILAEKMVFYGQDEPGAPRNQYRGIKLADGTSATYFDAFGMLAVLGVAEEAKMLQSWGWDDYRLLVPIERNPDFTDFSTYPDLGQSGTIPNMSWAAIEAALQEQGAKDLYNKYKTELQGSADMFEFLSNYVTLWVYVYTGSTPRVLSGTSGCRYMQAAAHDAEFGEFYQRMQKLQAQGDEIWGYVACEPQWHSPYQNILLFNDGTEARTMFWTSYMLGQTGWLYWREDFYGAANTNTYPMRAPYSNTGPGDGILVYPGAIYGQIDPIPSIRFINMRDGVEDYQLLCMIEQYYGEAKAMELVNNIVTSTVTFTHDDNKIYSIHAQILKLLEEAK